MDELSDILSPDAVQASLSVPNKKALFQQLAAIAGKLVAIEPKHVVERLVERERLGSTGFGGAACEGSPPDTRRRAYIITVITPVATSAPAQITSRLNQARRSIPTPTFSNTSSAMNADTAR